jgi:CheY-like chemotaxis protein
MASILLADDDSAVRDLVRRALTTDGHSVHVTEDGAEALDYLQAHASAVDILVTDVDMPALDGISLCEKAIALKPQLGIVLMSGFSDQLDRANALKAQRLTSIAKPFTLEQIKAKVRGILG